MMKNVHAILVFLLVVIVSMSSILCFSSNNDAADEEIFMVIDNETTMHDLDVGLTSMSKADHRVQIGKFRLEDGKVLTLSRKSSPSKNCVPPGEDQPCGALDYCCNGLECDGFFNGRCHPVPGCIPGGGSCDFWTAPCCYPYLCTGHRSDEGNTSVA